MALLSLAVDLQHYILQFLDESDQACTNTILYCGPQNKRLVSRRCALGELLERYQLASITRFLTVVKSTSTVQHRLKHIALMRKCEMEKLQLQFPQCVWNGNHLAGKIPDRQLDYESFLNTYYRRPALTVRGTGAVDVMGDIYRLRLVYFILYCYHMNVVEPQLCIKNLQRSLRYGRVHDTFIRQVLNVI